CNSILRCPSISDGRLSYQFSSDGYIRRSVYAYSKTVVPGESSATVKQRVMAARERQFKRQNKLNAWLDSPEIRQFCKLESEDAMWLEGTLIHLGLSIRAWQRLLKVARTIADIDQSDIITRQHLQEAVSYRAIDRLLIHLQKLLT
ncbi:hypothetical protein NEL98_02255, partial [Escherichia coli]|nr:hypothetical protein [Escherichia coli]